MVFVLVSNSIHYEQYISLMIHYARKMASEGSIVPVRLRVRELAEARGLNISSLQREAKIPMSTARRVWYSTSNGSAAGPPLKLVNLEVIDQLAQFFGVEPGALLTRET